MTYEEQIEILIKDYCTESEAIKHLKRGTVVFEDFETYFSDYMTEWNCTSEEIEEFKKMIETKKPVRDWGVVENGGKTYYIAYCL